MHSLLELPRLAADLIGFFFFTIRRNLESAEEAPLRPRNQYTAGSRLK